MLGRWPVVLGGIFALVSPVHADPDAPPLDSLHLRREDAQRAADQLSPRAGLPASNAPIGMLDKTPPPVFDPGTSDSDKARSAGRVLLGVAVASTLVGAPLYIIGGTNERIDGRSSDSKSFGAVLLVTAALSGGLGAALYLSSGPATRVSPVVTGHAVGLAISGTL